MFGAARNSPKNRDVKGLEERAEKIRKFEKWGSLTAVSLDDLRAAATPELWDKYWKRLDDIREIFAEAQKDADEISQKLERKFGDQ